MRPGGLDRRVTLQRATWETDPYGERIATWHDLATVFAQVRQQSGREFFAAAQIHAEKLVVFLIRWFPDVTVLDRVSYGGTAHDIAEVREIGRRDGMELHTVAAA